MHARSRIHPESEYSFRYCVCTIYTRSTWTIVKWLDLLAARCVGGEHRREAVRVRRHDEEDTQQP